MNANEDAHVERSSGWMLRVGMVAPGYFGEGEVQWKIGRLKQDGRGFERNFTPSKNEERVRDTYLHDCSGIFSSKYQDFLLGSLLANS